MYRLDPTEWLWLGILLLLLYLALTMDTSQIAAHG
jgi:hypothetical protein